MKIFLKNFTKIQIFLILIKFFLATFRFDESEKEWKDMEPIELVERKRNRETKEIKMITFNVLFNLYNENHWKKRYPKIIEQILHSDADIIGLQEVTKDFVVLLLADPFIQKNFFVSESLLGSTIIPYGQILLSKFPFRTLLHNLSNSKRVIRLFQPFFKIFVLILF
jgi:poly(A) polymerase